MTDVKKALKENGYVVIKNALDAEEVKTVRKLFWDKLKTLNASIDPSDYKTWANERWPGDFRTGFVTNHGTAHCEAVWRARANPKIKAAFAEIWGTYDLITSMDAVIMWRPWSKSGKYGYKPPRTEGLHVDQNPEKQTFLCAQGMLVMRDVTPETGGLEVVPKTHTVEMSKHILSTYGGGGDFCTVSAKDKLWKKKNKLIEAKAGDFIIWDSRTVHGGLVGTGFDDEYFEGDTSSIDVARLAFTICMVPKSLASEDIMKKRKEFFKNGYTSTHWPQKCLLGRWPDSNGTKIDRKRSAPIELTPEQLALL